MMMGKVQQGRAVVREMSIRQALEWAFGVEHAQLEFDEYRADGERPGTDTIWRLMRQGQLGCEIDGGGRSLPHDDADIIASFVARLPNGCGGRAMAVQIAELARAGRAPDWMEDAVPRCVPVGWGVENRYGRFAVTEDARSLGDAGWQPYERRGRKGRTVIESVLYCPVHFTPTQSQIMAARRNYLGWWGALLDLQVGLSSAGLRSVRVTGSMPPRAPWEARRAKVA